MQEDTGTARLGPKKGQPHALQDGQKRGTGPGNEGRGSARKSPAGMEGHSGDGAAKT